MKPSADEFVVQRSLPRYGLAVLSVGIALGVALLLEHFHFRAPAALLLLLAVAIPSWYGGRGPGLTATFLSTAAYYYYFVEPVRTAHIYLSEIPHFVTFVVFALLLSWFGAFRRRAEAGLRERASLLDLTHDTVFVMDMDGMIKYWNRGAEERYGWTAKQAVGRFVHGLLATIFPVPLEDLKAEITHTGRWEGELRHSRKDGTQVVVASRWSLERDEQGRPLAILETNNDITERKRAEEALRRLNRELRAISNCNQTLLRATDEQSLLEEICRIACEEAGYRHGVCGLCRTRRGQKRAPGRVGRDRGGVPGHRGITWADTERGRGQTGTAIRSGKTCCIQDFATDPQLAPWREDLLQRGFRSAIALPLKDEEGRTFGTLTIHSEQPNAFTPEEIRLLEELAGDMAFGIVTMRSQDARKRAEETIRRQEMELRQVLDLTPLLVAVFGPGRERLYANRPTLDHFGVTLEEWANNPDPLWFYHPDDRERIARDAYTGDETPHEFEARFRKSDGTYRWFLFRDNPVRDEEGRITRWYFSATDIEDIKRAEEERTARVWFLESMDRINRAMQGTNDLEQMMNNSIDAMLSIFDSDRVFLYYPCDPEAPSFEVVMERTRPGFPEARGVISMTPDTARGFQIVRTSSGVVTFGPGCDHPLIGDFTKRSGHKSSIGTALYPKAGKPWVLAMHQCSYPRVWTPVERKLLEEIARRLEDSLTSLLMFRSLRESEKALRQSEAYLAEAERINHTGTWAWNPAGGIQYWSKECYGIMGFDPGEGVPSLQRFLEAVHPDDLPRLRERFQSVAGELTNYETEYRIIRPSGEVRDLRVIGHPVVDSAGNFLEYVGTSIDITERKRAEEALRQSEAELRQLVDAIPQQVFVFDADWNPVFANRRELDYTGLTPQETQSKDAVARVFHPEDLKTLESARERAHSDAAPFEMEARVRGKDGGYRWFLIRDNPLRDEQGRVLRWYGTRTDIEERKQAEEALRRSEAYLADAQRITHTGVWAGDRDSKPLYWSAEVYRIFGFDPQHGLPTAEQALERIHPDDFDKFQRATINEKGYLESEYRIVLPDGTLKYVFGSAHPVLDRNGGIVEVVGVIVDITERKRAEEALRENEMRFRTFVDHAGDALFIQDLEDGTIIDGNGPACESLGYTRQELIGKATVAIHLDSDRARLEAVAGRAATGETVVDTHLHRRKDGSVFPVEANTSSFRYGGRLFLLHVSRDITDRLRAEKQRDRLRQLEADLAHIDRVNILGELAASISHELNQPIAASIMNASLALQWLEHDPPDLAQARQRTLRIIEAGTLGSEIIDRLRSLYKKEPPKQESLTMNEVIGEMVGLLRAEATRHAVSVRADLADGLPIVLGDPVQIQQVLMNLMLNGIEAMSDTGGVLTVKSQLKENGQIEISVNDTGPGLPEGKADQIFDAFFTTKPQGSGMGLAISKSIVESHGGRIWANDNGGRGATFQFSLPVAPAEASLPAEVSEGPFVANYAGPDSS